MKISRSKVIELGSALIIFIFIFVFAFTFDSNKKGNNTYAFNENSLEKTSENEETPKEDSDNAEVVQVENKPEEPQIVYDNMTLDELSDKLNRTLSSNLSGYGNFVATYALEKGIDPYLAVAIMMHETGCEWGCSSLVRQCNNVGGMKGSGCGAYGYFNTLEEGIQRFIDNIYNNYYAYGLTNANLMGSKYAEDPEWSNKVNTHIEKIKNR